MSKPPQIEKVQPCLLDRLIDENPEATMEAIGRGVPLARYRKSVLRDLEWLLNAKSRLADEGLQDFPETETSVLNFGMNDPAGKISDAATITKIERNIERALLRFEPRIIPETLQIRVVESPTEKASATPNVLGFEISGELWASPMNEHLYVKTEIDLETGKCHL